MTRRRPVSVLLDSNVWRYLVDEGNVPELMRQARLNRIEIQVAPSVVYEALRTRDAALRSRLVAAMGLRPWRRLMPEAYEEALEVLAELRRARPAWIAAEKEPPSVLRLRLDWSRPKGGWWDRALHETEDEAQRIAEAEGDRLLRARAQAEISREASRQAGWSFDTTRLDDVTAHFVEPTEGWDGDAVEAWRVSAFYAFSEVLFGEESTYAEWLGPFLHLQAALRDEAAWLRFWLYEINIRSVPRCWLRWAFEHLQSLRKVSAGTPCDAQLGTYLVSCDHFISADKAMTAIAERVRKGAPFRIAKSWSLPATDASPLCQKSCPVA